MSTVSMKLCLVALLVNAINGALVVPVTDKPTMSTTTTLMPTKDPTTTAEPTPKPTTTTTDAPTTTTPSPVTSTTLVEETSTTISVTETTSTLPTTTTNKECCKLGKGYKFQGEACVMSGDPHITMFSGGNHDFMGQPMTTNSAGQFQDAFYYVARCKGSSKVDMPFQILATHYHGRSEKAVTSIDYLTFELNDGDDLYYMYFSSVFQAYAKAGTTGVSISYDRTLATAPSALTTIKLGSKTTIGNMFAVKFSKKNAKKLAVDCRLFVSFWDDGAIETKQVYVHMRGGSVRKSANTPYPSRKRRTHYVMIKQNDEFKCATCGLCGNFQGSIKKPQQSFEQCNGKSMTVTDGFKSNSAVYDETGWTFEYNYFNKKCGKTKTYTKKLGSKASSKTSRTTDECPAWKQKIVNAECNKASKIAVVQTCCKKLGSKACARLVAGCKSDTCLMADDNKASIKTQVREGLTAEIEDLCEIDGVAELMQPKSGLVAGAPQIDDGEDVGDELVNDEEFFDDEQDFDDAPEDFDDDVIREPDDNDDFFDDVNDDEIDHDVIQEPDDSDDFFDDVNDDDEIDHDYFDDGNNGDNDYFVGQPLTFSGKPLQPIQPFQPVSNQPDEFIVSFTAEDLLIIALVLLNIFVVTAVIVTCTKNASKPQQISITAKMMAETEDDEEAHFVQ